jgi:acetyl esterase/lipase
MKNKILVLLICIVCKFNIYAVVDFGATYTTLHSYYGLSCNGQQYVTVGFTTNFETNNSTFQIQRSLDPSFSGAVTGTPSFNGNMSGCGTCGGKRYEVDDYGPFVAGEVWYYRVKATSNWMVDTYKDLGTVTFAIPTVINWISQVANSVTIGSSPNTESSYVWRQELKDMQGVTISLIPTEISNIYLEENNNKINFSVSDASSFSNIDVSVDNQSYVNLYNGSSRTGFVWDNSYTYFTGLGVHNLRVKYTVGSGTIYFREYTIHVVQKSDGLYIDNYCNSMRVWKSNNALGGRPLTLSEGFDAYNLKSEQYYREAGKDLINCLLNKGFDIYIVNYNLNSQSIRNNAAVYTSAIKYVSNINNGEKIIVSGISMGGIIAKYALAKAEQDGNPLPANMFLTLDSPHQSASVDKKLQDYIHNEVASSDFEHHAGNNDAAKELLVYNTYDPTSIKNIAFYDELNHLNGDGYPHLTKNIGVSFSNAAPNPNSGLWLSISLHEGPIAATYKEFNIEDDPNISLAGSYLPRLVKDQSYVSNDYMWLIWPIFPFFDPLSSTLTQIANPTFIAHNSSLDMVNGVSKFGTNIIQPLSTSFHDVVPSDIIEPLMNKLMDPDLYLQNKVVSGTKNYSASNNIQAGNNVTANLPVGDFVLSSGSNVSLTAENQITLKSGFTSQSGSNFSAKIGLVHFDCNSSSSQFRSIAAKQSNPTPDYEIIDNETAVEHPIYSNETITIIRKNSYLIHPNPANDYFIIESDIIPKQINVYNSLGVLIVENTSLESSVSKIDLSSQPLGVYFVKVIEKDGNIFNTKIIKQ